jgi:hypothetical protein
VCSLDDEEKRREELKYLIEESYGEDLDVSKPSKKEKSYDDLDDWQEDEDYDLIEENLGVKLERVSFIKKM